MGTPRTCAHGATGWQRLSASCTTDKVRTAQKPVICPEMINLQINMPFDVFFGKVRLKSQFRPYAFRFTAEYDMILLLFIIHRVFDDRHSAAVIISGFRFVTQGNLTHIFR